MKKLFTTLVLCGLLAPTATMAQTEPVTDLSQLSNDKVYTLKSERAFLLYSDAQGVSGQICSSTGSAVGTVAQNPLDPNQQFRIEKKGDSYYLFSVGAEKYVGATGNYEATASSPLTIEKVTNANYPWKLCVGGNGMNSQIQGQMPAGIVVNSWTSTDAGNCYAIESVSLDPVEYTIHVLGTEDEAAGVVYNEQEYKNNGTFSTKDVVKKADFAALPIDGKVAVVSIDGKVVYVSYFNNDTKFYTIQNGKGGYVSLNPDYMGGDYMKLANTNAPQDNQGIWAFVEKANGVYNVYNYSTGLSKVLGMTGSEAGARAKMVEPEATTHTTEFDGTFSFDGKNPSYIKLKGTSSNYWNDRNSFLALWNSSGAIGDTGSKFFLDEVDFADYPDEYFYEVSEIEGIAAFSPKNPNTLWYTTSAEASGVSYPWMEYALPLGNGELGCMVFGGVHNEELQFNEKTLWSGPANTVGAGSGNRTFMNFGSLFITNLDKAIWDGVTDYVRYLDIEEGIAGVEFKNANGTKQIRKFFSSAPDQVIAGKYTVEGDEKLNLLFKLDPGTGIGAGDVVYENGTASFTGKMTAVSHAARLHVVADEGATITTSAKGITVSNANEVTFYLKGGTNFNGDMEVLDNYFTTETASDVDARIKGEIEAAVAKGYAAVEAAHIEDFTAITKRMTFDLGLTTPTVDTKTLIDGYYPNNSGANSTANDHLFLEQLYFHYGRYLAISSNRKPIAAPNNLQGIWNDRGTDSPWNSDIHTNINIQMNYWPTEITNLSDLHKPYVNFIIRGAQSSGWKEVAKRYNNGYGWSVLTESSLYNSMSTWGDNYLVANVWYTSHLWTHYRYTQDKEFLKKAFPVMWSCAEFWFHRLIQDRKVKDGTYVAPNEFSAEQHGNESEDGTAHAQQMISYLFQNLSEAIEILGVEETGLTAAEVEKLNHYLEKTDKGLHTETYNGAWGNPFNGVKTGDVLLREWKYSPYSVGERGHRHISHLMALFPMDQITPESEYFVPAVNALKHRGDAATGWSMGWKVNLWARAQDGDHAHIIIKNALKHSTTYGTDQGQGGIYYNLFDSHAPFQIDGNFGVCSGMAEMLLQSAHGYINILPALPAVWKKSGKVTGMKAMGNFTVDFEWANGECKSARIVSNAGAALRVRCALGAMELAKASIKVDGVEVGVTVDEHGVVTIPCGKDAVVDIDFTTTSAIAPVAVDGNKANSGKMYDLNGRRIATVLSGQVYIQDGIKKLAK
ncbi:MAG: glycoside hydrolase family 95 protein [Bacteroidaceae bacterium]|nr:glycoside hydrolase family 95 protein [Bacteroidaceae bacterium]